MDLPLEIVPRNLTLSDSLSEEIRGRADQLDLIYGRIVRCRVTVEGPGPHHRHGRYAARIRLTVPGSEIQVNHQRGGTAHEAVTKAFAAADRRVEDYVRRAHLRALRGRRFGGQARGFVKRHAGIALA